MLEDITVLSFTHFVQGPSAAQVLADLGANVIKIEAPTGAFERHVSGCDAFVGDVSVMFAIGNRNQRSLAIDLRSEIGREVIHKLVRKSDVLIENFRPGALERLGLSYEQLHEHNPRLIYCSLTGYGLTGPYRDRPGQDLLAQSISGLCMLTGPYDGPPTPVGTAIIDQHGAVLGALSVLAALHNREITHTGMRVESSLLNAALDLQLESLGYFLNRGSLWERSRTGISTRFDGAPYGIFATSDGWITISITPIEKLQDAFQDDNFKRYTKSDQTARRDEVNESIAKIVSQKSCDEWARIFEPLGIWYAPVNDYQDVVEDPQVKINRMIATINHPDVGPIKVVNHPARYNGQAPKVEHGYPPRLGEHTREILSDLGYTDDMIDGFIRDGVVVTSQTRKM